MAEPTTTPPLTQADVQAIRERANAAKAGPWVWLEAQERERMVDRSKATKKRDFGMKPGFRSGDLWVYLLAGAPHHPYPHDCWDYAHIMGMRWESIRGKTIVGATAVDSDASFIAAARTDVPALCDALEAAWRERDELRAERSVLRSALLNVQSTAQNARLRGV